MIQHAKLEVYAQGNTHVQQDYVINPEIINKSRVLDSISNGLSSSFISLIAHTCNHDATFEALSVSAQRPTDTVQRDTVKDENVS